MVKVYIYMVSREYWVCLTFNMGFYNVVCMLHKYPTVKGLIQGSVKVKNHSESQGQEEVAIIHETKITQPLSELFTRKSAKKLANSLANSLMLSYYRPSTFLLYRINQQTKNRDLFLHPHPTNHLVKPKPPITTVLVPSMCREYNYSLQLTEIIQPFL